MEGPSDFYLTCKEIAFIFDVRPATVRRWAREQRLPHLRLNARVIRFRLQDVEALIDASLRPAVRPFHHRLNATFQEVEDVCCGEAVALL